MKSHCTHHIDVSKKRVGETGGHFRKTPEIVSNYIEKSNSMCQTKN
jgi:hypothetical protein